jgi:hypothetical protein
VTGTSPVNDQAGRLEDVASLRASVRHTEWNRARDAARSGHIARRSQKRAGFGVSDLSALGTLAWARMSI